MQRYLSYLINLKECKRQGREKRKIVVVQYTVFSFKFLSSFGVLYSPRKILNCEIVSGTI